MSAANHVKAYGPAYGILLGISGIFALAALLTLLPNPAASWPNILGYKSLCTFSPGATIACALLAAVTCTLRARLVRRKPGPVFVPVVLIAMLVVSLAWSTVIWANEKARYTSPDATAAASTVAPLTSEE